MTLLNVEVVKAVRADASAGFIRRVLARAVTVPELEARMPDGETTVAVRVTTDDEMERLNSTYAGERHATDVLSFAGTAGHLGDIAVSWAATQRQAAEFGHDPSTELALLCIHGLLHLLGWDHARARERKEMSRLTVAALARSGIKVAAGRP